MKPSEFLQQLRTVTKEELLTIKGVGDVLADNVVEFASSERMQKLQEKFQSLEESSQAPELLETAITGQVGVVCITGTFDIPREQIKQILEKHGYKVVDSVTRATTLLLAGNDAGSKLEKANKLGIRIVHTYTELL